VYKIFEEIEKKTEKKTEKIRECDDVVVFFCVIKDVKVG